MYGWWGVGVIGCLLVYYGLGWWNPRLRGVGVKGVYLGGGGAQC